MRAAGWVFLLCLPSVALADIPPAQDLAPLHRPSRPMREAAQQHYQAGERFFRDAQFDAAIVEFEAAYKLSGEPDMVYNLSRTSEKAGKVKEALEYAARYQTLVVGTDEEERAQRRIEFLRGRYSVEQAQPKPPEQSPAKLAEQPPAVATAPDPAPNVASAPPCPPPTSKARGKVPPRRARPPLRPRLSRRFDQCLGRLVEAWALVTEGEASTQAGSRCRSLVARWRSTAQFGRLCHVEPDHQRLRCESTPTRVCVLCDPSRERCLPCACGVRVIPVRAMAAHSDARQSRLLPTQ